MAQRDIVPNRRPAQAPLCPDVLEAIAPVGEHAPQRADDVLQEHVQHHRAFAHAWAGHDMSAALSDGVRDTHNRCCSPGTRCPRTNLFASRWRRVRGAASSLEASASSTGLIATTPCLLLRRPIASGSCNTGSRRTGSPPGDPAPPSRFLTGPVSPPPASRCAHRWNAARRIGPPPGPAPSRTHLHSAWQAWADGFGDGPWLHRHVGILAENIAASAVELTSADLAELDQVVPPGAAAGMRYPEWSMQAVNR